MHPCRHSGGVFNTSIKLDRRVRFCRRWDGTLDHLANTKTKRLQERRVSERPSYLVVFFINGRRVKKAAELGRLATERMFWASLGVEPIPGLRVEV
jgi:hypothetical protein